MTKEEIQKEAERLIELHKEHIKITDNLIDEAFDEVDTRKAKQHALITVEESIKILERLKRNRSNFNVFETELTNLKLIKKQIELC